MNILEGIITRIETSGSLSIVKVEVGDISLKTILIETSNTAPYLKKGNNVNVIFKETEVAVGKGVIHNNSMQNRIPGSILEIERGELLSKLTIGATLGKIKAIITSSAVEELQLMIGEKVTAMIKTNEIMLSE